VGNSRFEFSLPSRYVASLKNKSAGSEYVRY
jgi:hypothetical protein